MLSCDRILVMDQGRIVEEGTHADAGRRRRALCAAGASCSSKGVSFGSFSALTARQLMRLHRPARGRIDAFAGHEKPVALVEADGARLSLLTIEIEAGGESRLASATSAFADAEPQSSGRDHDLIEIDVARIDGRRIRPARLDLRAVGFRER